VALLLLSLSEFTATGPDAVFTEDIKSTGHCSQHRRGGEDTHAEGPPGGAEAGGSA
jgi:hypothetical protein